MRRDALRAKALMWLLVVPALGWGFSVRAQGPSAQLSCGYGDGSNDVSYRRADIAAAGVQCACGSSSWGDDEKLRPQRQDER